MSINTRERADRIHQKWNQHPNLSEDEVLELVDADLAYEREAQEETDRKSADLARSFDSMTRCGACGATALGAALCDPCSRRNRKIEDDLAATTPDGRDRDGLVRAYRAKIGR